MRLLLALAALLSALLPGAPALAAPGLWVVRQDKTEVAIFGTVHALPKGRPWLTPVIEDRLRRADRLVLETVLPDDPLAVARLAMRLGMRPGLKPLAQRLSPEAARRLTPALAAAGLPPAALDGMESWLAAITISEAALSAIGIDPKQGVEPQLTAGAKRWRVAVEGLETPEEQLGFLDGLAEADQVAMVEATLAESGDIRRETEQLIGAWAAGDVDRIAADFAQEARATPGLAQVLLTNRNRRWADEVGAMLRRPGRVFLAVGAAHLGGPDGLLAILRNRGFAVEAVDTDAAVVREAPARGKAGKAAKAKDGKTRAGKAKAGKAKAGKAKASAGKGSKAKAGKAKAGKSSRKRR